MNFDRSFLNQPDLMKAPYSWIVNFSILLFVSFSSCKKDDQTPDPTPVIPTSPSNTTLVVGRVIDESGSPISGVLISAGSISSYSNSEGTFILSGVSGTSRVFVSATKSGYFKGSKGAIAENNGITKIELTLLENTPNFTANASTSNTLELSNGSGVDLSPNSIQSSDGSAYSGSFQVAIVHLDPSDPDFENKVPGGDLIGIDAASQEQQLLSYGMLLVQMTDNSGNELQIASGNTATIKMKVASTQLSSAPSSIPLWHFNETTGKWEEQGTATLQGDTYVGTVSHFSTWNCDYAGSRATVRGIIRDCNGNILSGIRVRVGQTSAFTDASGQYETFAPSGVDFDIAVESPELGIMSTPISISSLTAGSVFDAPTISVACPGYVTMSLACSSGSSFNASVSVNWGSNQSVFGSTQTPGTFKIAVPTNGQSANIIVTSLTNGDSYSVSLTLPTSANQEVNAGTFEMCNTSSSGNTIQSSFTINGDGFNNQTITINAIPVICYTVYNTTDSTTVGIAMDTYGLSILFPGNATNSFVINNNNSDILATITNNGNSWVADSVLTLNITEYGPVGGRVKGNFNGVFKRVDYNQTSGVVNFYYATVTNGHFEYIRHPDEN